MFYVIYPTAAQVCEQNMSRVPPLTGTTNNWRTYIQIIHTAVYIIWNDNSLCVFVAALLYHIPAVAVFRIDRWCALLVLCGLGFGTSFLFSESQPHVRADTAACLLDLHRGRSQERPSTAVRRSLSGSSFNPRHTGFSFGPAGPVFSYLLGIGTLAIDWSCLWRLIRGDTAGAQQQQRAAQEKAHRRHDGLKGAYGRECAYGVGVCLYLIYPVDSLGTPLRILPTPSSVAYICILL